MGKIKTTLNKSVFRLLNRIVQLLLRYEVAHGEFAELSRRSYVDVAFKYYSLPNRKNTVSRVSVITGLSRPEVMRLVELNNDPEFTSHSTPNRAIRVIGGWLSDSDYLDDGNEPKVLPIKNEDISFETLVNRYSGGISARAILDEMIRTGAVQKMDSETVKLLHHGFIPHDDDEEMIKILMSHVADLLSTGIHNITEKEKEPRFQRRVDYVDMPEDVVKEFEELSREKSMELLLELNEWLANKKKQTKLLTGVRRSRVGLGIYYFNNDDQED